MKNACHTPPRVWVHGRTPQGSRGKRHIIIITIVIRTTAAAASLSNIPNSDPRPLLTNSSSLVWTRWWLRLIAYKQYSLALVTPAPCHPPQASVFVCECGRLTKKHTRPKSENTRLPDPDIVAFPSREIVQEKARQEYIARTACQGHLGPTAATPVSYRTMPSHKWPTRTASAKAANSIRMTFKPPRKAKTPVVKVESDTERARVMMQQFNIPASSLPDPIVPTSGNRTQLVEIPVPSFSSTPKKQAAVSTSYVELNIRSDWPKAQSSQPTASSQFGENSQRSDWPKVQSSQPTASSQFGENSQRSDWPKAQSSQPTASSQFGENSQCGDWPKAQSSQPTASSQFGENSQCGDWPKAQSSQPTASSQFGENFQRGDWHSNQPITYSQNGKKFQRSDWSNSNSNQPTATSQNGANSQRCDWPKAQSSQPTESSQFGANFQRSDWPNFKSNEPIATSQNGENSQRGDWPSNQPIASSQNGENFQRGDWPKAQSSQPTASSQYGENFQRGDWSNFKSNESTASSQHGENNVPSQVPERWRNCQEPRLAEDSPRYSYAEALKTNNSPAAKAATRTYTPTRIFTPTKNRIVNNSPGKAVNTSIANQIMASWYNQPDRRDRCSPNARRWPLENRSYLHPSPIPTRRFSDGNGRKVLNVEPDEGTSSKSEASDSSWIDIETPKKNVVSKKTKKEKPNPPKPEEQIVFEWFEKKLEKKFEKTIKSQDEKIDIVAKDIRYVNMKVDQQSAAIGNIQARVEQTERATSTGVDAVKNLKQATERNDANINQLRHQVGTEFVQFNQQVKNTVEIVANKLQEHDDDIKDNEKAIYQLIQKSKGIERDVEVLKVQPNQGGGRYTKIKTMPITTDNFKHMGIVFDEQEKYHPHFFVETFEANVKNDQIDEIFKCNLFRSLIEVKGAKIGPTT
ncbi:hypothetical protein U1Q18_051396 [Sarracenia purpurea var. burkii]